MAVVIHDMLSLVMENPPPAEVIASWSDEDRQEVEDWAEIEHLYASDNYIRRKPMPEVIKRWQKSVDARSRNANAR
jgi:hypothetical protein